MTQEESIVYIVDDDKRVCEALEELMAASGLEAAAFNSVGEYLAYTRQDRPSCLILDVHLPDINGLEFQKQIGSTHPPIIFITGYGDIPSSVGAIKRGAVDFLTKPFSDVELMNSIRTAIDRDREARIERAELTTLQDHFGSLTLREREVLGLVVSGLLNKQAAAQLGISEVTLQIHRSRIMHKMEAASLADLVRIAEKLQIPISHSRRGGTSSK
ncbi:response regulator [Rhizobium sp. BK251]|uniref:response regulator transcription factor n=1 Tax=Rhizobium sp. BK251 TaxID=2512125 RepID=UPI00104F52A4|nr:response regulator [Rhizobium sp. BK251]TCL68076.1 LuxR family two component transcriptional regulator [Rhizobium sp. BK251]